MTTTTATDTLPTAALAPPPAPARPSPIPPPPLAAAAAADCSATLAIPLAEFGKTLADPNLDRWFEAFSERNSNSGHTYAIAAAPACAGKGALLIMPPTGNPGVLHEGTIYGHLYIWTRTHGGFAYPANARFTLPDGSRFGPDAAWVREERRAELLLPDNRPFPHIVPDFIVEVQSPSNSRAELVSKINLFLTYGTRLAWLIDAASRVVIKYRPDQEPETLHNPEFIAGDDDILPGFTFPVRDRIFDYYTATDPALTRRQ